MGLARNSQSLLAEDAAELGLHVVAGPGRGEVLPDVVLPFDGEPAERLDRSPLTSSRFAGRGTAGGRASVVGRRRTRQQVAMAADR
ncbi:MAG: hypothetical protein ACRDRK_25195 [Pseudonocardia sp.]